VRSYQRFKPHSRVVVIILGNGQHPTHLHEGRTHSELGAPSSSSNRNVTVPSGHNLYVKCARLYQSMSNLRDDHPAAYRDFVSGLHVERRSDHLWVGLSADLVMEPEY